MTNCKLCLKPKELRNSHIIPDAFWRGIKTNGQYISIELDKNQFGQDSHTERLLCQECEVRLSQIEAYAIKLCLQNPDNIGVTINSFEKYKKFSGVNYAKLKLFQLSVLWRASISKVYSDVKLLEIEEERLRTAIDTNTPLLERDYGCLMNILWINNDPKSTRDAKAFMITPYSQQIGEQQFLTFVFGGFEWRFSYPTCSQHIVNECKVITTQGLICCKLKDVHDDPVMLKVACNGYKNQKDGLGVNV